LGEWKRLETGRAKRASVSGTTHWMIFLGKGPWRVHGPSWTCLPQNISHCCNMGWERGAARTKRNSPPKQACPSLPAPQVQLWSCPCLIITTRNKLKVSPGILGVFRCAVPLLQDFEDLWSSWLWSWGCRIFFRVGATLHQQGMEGARCSRSLDVLDLLNIMKSV
jgi:hypothetical protein